MVPPPGARDGRAVEHTTAHRVARLVTELLAPAILTAALPVIVGVHATESWTGFGWGVLALVFTAAIPYGLIRIGMIRGTITDHHISVRQQRAIPLLSSTVSVAVGFAVLSAFDAPTDLRGAVAVIFAELLCVAVVNFWWKFSAHTAVAAGTATVLVLAISPLLVLTAAPVALLAWSRVRLGDHTLSQVVAGITVGTPIAALVFSAFG